jgi:hypothetical protein
MRFSSQRSFYIVTTNINVLFYQNDAQNDTYATEGLDAALAAE